MIFMAPYPHPYQPLKVEHGESLRRAEDVVPGHDMVSIPPMNGELYRVLCECGWFATLTEDASSHLGVKNANDLLVARVKAHEEEERAKGGMTLEDLEALGWFDEEASV